MEVNRFVPPVRTNEPLLIESLLTEAAICNLVAVSVESAKSVTAKGFVVEPVVSIGQLIEARGACENIYVDDKVKQYIVSLVVATREPEWSTVPSHRITPVSARIGRTKFVFTSIVDGRAIGSRRPPATLER